MRFISWLIALFITVSLPVFVVFNNETANVVISPFHDAYNVPVYLVGIGGIAIGFLTGGIMVWTNGGKIRHQKRKQAKQIKALNKQLETQHPNNAETPPSDFFPSLPSRAKNSK